MNQFYELSRQKKRRKTTALFLYFFLLFFIFFIITHAADVQVDFGSSDFQTKNVTIPSYIGNLYLFGLGIGGVLAVGMIIFGGVLSIAEAATPDKKNEGKELIIGALWGLALLLFSYLILKTVNPELVNLRDPGGEFAKNVDYENCQNNTNLPYCADMQPPSLTMIDDEGKCICRNKTNSKICSKDWENLGGSNPTYAWTEEGKYFVGGNRTFQGPEIPPVANEIGGCPKEVRLEAGTTPFRITSIEGDKFLMDITELKENGKFTNDENDEKKSIPLPLPEGEYKAYFSVYYIKDKPNKAICLMDKVVAILASDPSRVISAYPLEPLEGVKDLGKCTEFSSSTKNEGELKVKKKPKDGGNCDVLSSGPCSLINLTNSLPLSCAAFLPQVSSISKICNHESGGNPDLVSQSDWCNGPACYGPADKNHSASIGLFQINVSQNFSFLPSACKHLYNGTVSGGRACNPKYKNGYRCSFSGDQTTYDACRNELVKPAVNIGMMCNLMQGRRDKNEGIFSDWLKTIEDCDIENIK